jgi:hypothetical protein
VNEGRARCLHDFEVWFRPQALYRTCGPAWGLLMGKILIILGGVLIVIGLLWPWLQQLPFGRLPGDILIKREGFQFFFPLTTCILISILITLIFWLLKK